MNILSQLTRQTIRRNRTRSVAVFFSVFLAAAMFTVLTTVVFSLWDYVRRGTEYETGDYFVSADYVDETELEAVNNDPLIRRISDLKITAYFSLFEHLGPTTTYPVAAVDKAFFDDMAVPLKEGRLPENSSEIIIPSNIEQICLKMGWKIWEIGDTVTLDLFDLREARNVEETPGWTEQYRPEETWQREYSIVGISEDKAYSDDENNYGHYCVLTLSDGAEGEVLWHRLFLRTAPKDAAAVLAKHYGQKSFLNQDLLRVYGAGGMAQGTVIFLIIVAAALLIIAVLSAVLIRSIFSVSVTERTREFGLLASIGTTPKQISGLVRREALTFLAASLPLGLAAGVLAAGLLLSHYRDILASWFTFGESVSLSLRIAPAALLAAVIICTLTVMFSVADPAKRASRIVPLEAIRQNRDIRIREMRLKSKQRFSGLLGVPGWVGTRYARVSRRKSRAVTAALSLTLALFLPAVFLAGIAEKQADAYTADFDFVLQSAGGRIDSDIVEKLRTEPEISDSVLYSVQNLYAVFAVSDLQEDYKKVHSAMNEIERKDYSSAFSCEPVQISYIEDSIFINALAAEGLDPEPYISGDSLTALIVPHEYSGYMAYDENGGWQRLRYQGYGIENDHEELLCVALGIPFELDALPGEGTVVGLPYYQVTNDGELLLENQGKTWLLEFEAEEDYGDSTCTYRSYDISTGKAGDPVVTAKLEYLRLHPQKRLKEAPDGCCSPGNITFILPLSKLPEREFVSLGIRVRNLVDYYSLLAKLKTLVNDNPLLVYSDYRAGAANSLGLAALIRGIAVGFLIVVSLLCTINVFYTMSTNIMLRQRDFGILRSIGFTGKDLLKMVAMEGIGSGSRALLIGVPVGIGLCYVLHRLEASGMPLAYRPPWGALLLGISLILLLMLVSTLYGLRLLKHATPIEAIREENI